MSVLQQIDDKIAEHNKSLNWTYFARMFILQHLDAFDSLPDATLHGDCIDFDNLPHEQVMQVIKAFPGRWKKEPDEGRINYSITLRNLSKTTDLVEIKIRCWHGEPPPSCQIVYEDVEVPAHRVRKAKLICVEPQPLNGDGNVPEIADREEAVIDATQAF